MCASDLSVKQNSSSECVNELNTQLSSAKLCWFWTKMIKSTNHTVADINITSKRTQWEINVRNSPSIIFHSWLITKYSIIKEISPRKSWQVAQQYTETPQHHMPTATSVSDKTTKASRITPQLRKMWTSHTRFTQYSCIKYSQNKYVEPRSYFTSLSSPSMGQL